MGPSTRSWRLHRLERPSMVLGAVAVCLLVAASFISSAHGAIVPTVGLGTAAQFSILAGTTVTNTGPTTVAHDLGVSPGSAVEGFPPGTVTPPAVIHKADAVALQAQNDLTTAYDDAALRPTTALTGSELGGLTLQGGVYAATAEAAPLQLTGTLTLDGAGDPSSVWIFQTDSMLTTATDSVVALINGASACNVFWQVGSSATLGTRTSFVGTLMALTSITLQDAVVVNGRTLARNGAVTLINDTFTGPDCTPVPTTTSTAPTSSTTGSPSSTASTSSTTPSTGSTASTSSTTPSPSSTTTSTIGTGTTTITTTALTTGGSSSTTLGAGGATNTTGGAGTTAALGGGDGGATAGRLGGTGGSGGSGGSDGTSRTVTGGSAGTTTDGRTIARTGQDIRSLLVVAAIGLWLGVVVLEIGRRRARRQRAAEVTP